MESFHQQWCDLLTGKLVLHYPLIDFLQDNIIVGVIALAY